MNEHSDKTFEAGNEEDFIRQLQEQLAGESSSGSFEDYGNSDSASDYSGNNAGADAGSKIAGAGSSFKKKTNGKKNYEVKGLKTLISVLEFFLFPLIIIIFSNFAAFKYENIFIRIVIFISVSLLSGLFYIFLFKYKSKKVVSASEGILEEIAMGKLGFDIDSDKTLAGSLGLLAGPIDKVIKEMSDIVTKIELSVLDIVGNSDALAYFANSMANKTTQQEDSVRKIDDFTKLINQSMENVRKNVEEAYKNSKDSIDEADKGSVEILSLIEEMKSISEMSDKIVETMHFINDIADETNLLALNAAIQAAHAGDEGRGFGVVASEIRNLAESSTTATKSIFSIIDNTINSIEKGVTASEKAKKAIGKIVGSIKSTEDIMSEINKSITVQASETTKLKVSVEDIKGLTENINSDTQNMKSAISNLAGQAQILNGIIKRFEVHAGSVHSGAIFGVDG